MKWHKLIAIGVTMDKRGNITRNYEGATPNEDDIVVVMYPESDHNINLLEETFDMFHWKDNTFYDAEMEVGEKVYWCKVPDFDYKDL